MVVYIAHDIQMAEMYLSLNKMITSRIHKVPMRHTNMQFGIEHIIPIKNRRRRTIDLQSIFCDLLNDLFIFSLYFSHILFKNQVRRNKNIFGPMVKGPLV